MAVPRRVRVTRRLLAAVPPLAALVLWLRRVKGEARISRVLRTAAAVERHYGIQAKVVSLTAADTGSLTTIREARVLAQPAAVVGPDWSLLWPYAPQLKRRPFGADFLWKRLPEQRGRLQRALYAGADGFSYYHWMTGTIPKILAAHRDQGAVFDAYLVNPRHKGKDNFQTETLKVLGIPPAKVFWLERKTHVLCDEITLPPEPCLDEQTRILPWAHALLRETFLPVAGERSAGSPEKIFISRAKARRRRLVDEPALEQALFDLGFVTVVLEELPFLEQVRLFAHAREVVALHGAGLTNLVFATKGTKVVEIVPDAWPNPCFANLAALGQLRYGSVVGRCTDRGRGFASDVAVQASALLRQLRIDGGGQDANPLGDAAARPGSRARVVEEADLGLARD